MQVKFAHVAFALAMVLLAPFGHAQGSASDRIAIQGILHEQADAWGKGDAKAYSRHFAAEGTFTNILGMFFTGQKEFEVRREQIFTRIFRGTAMKKALSRSGSYGRTWRWWRQSPGPPGF